MPKILPEMRERFIAAAKKRLLNGACLDVTIRQIALDCGCAVGTVYNYFPSKEALIAAVMMEDWQDCLAQMRRDAAACGSPLEALAAIAASLRAFNRAYSPLWRSWSGARDSVSVLSTRHQTIIDNLSAPVEEALQRFDAQGDEALGEVLSELILYASRTDDGFERIRHILQKILSP